MSYFDENCTLNYFRRLLAVDSTTGQYQAIQEEAAALIRELGYEPVFTHKGGVLADLGGEGNPLVITAHLDDIGLMVRHVNADGTLNVCPVGGLYPFYCVTENVRIYTAEGQVYTGSVCRTPNSIHVTEDELRKALGDFRTNVCVVLDQPVHSAEETRKLGIETGDYIALEPRFAYSGGYLKSRFVDDKACAAVLFHLMKTLREEKLPLNRKVIAYFACYEEIGHGTAWLPEGVRDVLALDIAPTGPEQNSDERKVSIFVKDSRFPYHSGMVRDLREAAKAAGADYVTDIFTPHYGSDGDGSVLAGHDIRHGAIGPGTANSHGYERTHIDGLRNTFELTLAYVTL
ncbi:MAG: M20/M25/M40 family metallo-hydrolase [Clostridiales bacterium]|nr:M20/M25/M40 family metallo-hydrolase [Clostridiales bacterium]